jgi:DNA polymerase-3 subunit epsilon
MITLTRPLISLDLETTGVDVSRDRIAQIACVRLDPDGTRSRRARLVNPGQPIPAEATAIHGIQDSDVEGEPTFAAIAKSLHHYLTGVDLAGYNVRRFDAPLLTEEFRRCGLEWPDSDTMIVDAFEIFRCQEPHDLAHALKFYQGRELVNAHDALADAEAALDVLTGQAYQYVGPRNVHLEDLAELARSPDWIDATGKLRWVEGVAVVNFGRWKDRPLAGIDPDYLIWVLGQDFPPDFKTICKGALDGVYPEDKLELPDLGGR